MQKNDCLPCYEDLYPNFFSYEQVELGRRRVLVQNIIGSSKFLKQYYNVDFSPKSSEKNSRYEKITDEVKQQLKKGKKTLDLGLIHLFKIVKKDASFEYFVGSDGNRRISNCKMLKVKYVFADITEVRVD